MGKTNSYNIAIDWAFWNNRIYGSLDVYYKKGVDQVVTKNVAPSTGASSVSINDGDVENKGWDLAVFLLFRFRPGTGCGVYHSIQVKTTIKC